MGQITLLQSVSSLAQGIGILVFSKAYFFLLYLASLKQDGVAGENGLSIFPSVYI